MWTICTIVSARLAFTPTHTHAHTCAHPLTCRLTPSSCPGNLLPWGMGHLCDFKLLHHSFPAGFLTKSLLTGAAGRAGSSYQNKIHKVRDKQDRKQWCCPDFKDMVTKEIEQRGTGKGRWGFRGIPSLSTVNMEYKAQVFITKKKKKSGSSRVWASEAGNGREPPWDQYQPGQALSHVEHLKPLPRKCDWILRKTY